MTTLYGHLWRDLVLYPFHVATSFSTSVIGPMGSTVTYDIAAFLQHVLGVEEQNCGCCDASQHLGPAA